MDALDPAAFDDVSDDTIATLAALAGAATRTASLIESLERVLAHKALVAHQLQQDAALRSGDEILGVSAAARRLREEVLPLASSDLTTPITGETGVGKKITDKAEEAEP